MAETVSDYMRAIAEYLAAESEFVWNPEGEYTSTQWGLFIKDVPLDPDRIGVLAPYVDTEDIVPTLRTREIDFQFRVRGGRLPTDCDDMADIGFKLLHKKHHLVWNDLEISRIRHLSFASLGPDSANRWERTDNYELITQRKA